MAEKKITDWEAIEREYRAGQLSVLEIGRQHGVSHTAINKRAKQNGWKRDLSEQVRREARARLVSEVSVEVSTQVSAAIARQAVDDAATRVVMVTREHRQDIKAARTVAKALVEELAEVSEKRVEIEEDIEAETKKDKTGERRARMLKAVSLSTRSGIIANLALAFKNLIGLERQAFNMNDVPPSDEPQYIEVDRLDRET